MPILMKSKFKNQILMLIQNQTKIQNPMQKQTQMQMKNLLQKKQLSHKENLYYQTLKKQIQILVIR